MVKQALILHGTDASPESNWFTWLKLQLERAGYSVWLPQLPGSDKPSTKTYNSFLLSSPDFEFNNETIIIGHSSGAVEILHLLQNLPSDKNVKAVFLVSPFKDDLGWDALKCLFIEPLDYVKIKAKSGKFVIIHSNNDPYVPLGHAEYISYQVDGELVIKSGQGHFNTELSQAYETFPVLLEIINKNT